MPVVDHHVENYIRSLLPASNEYFNELEAYALENNVPIVQAEVGRFLKTFVASVKPKRVLEVGTAIGYSGSLIAEAMNGGQLVTVELREDYVEIAKKNFERLDSKTEITVIHGDAEVVLKEIEGEFDLIFIDASKGHYESFFDQTYSKLSEEGIILSDNVLYKGMVATNEYLIRRKITIVKRMRKYLEMIHNHPSLDTTIIPMGDGLAISKRRNHE